MEASKELNLLGKVSDSFEEVKYFKLYIPDRDFKSYINNFAGKYKKEFFSFDSRLSDNLNRSVQELRAGNSYMVSILEIKRKMKSLEVINYINDRKAIFPGIYGSMYIWEFNKSELLCGKTRFYFGDKSEEVPQIHKFDTGAYSFNLDHLSDNLYPGDYIVYLRQYTHYYGSSPWDTGCPWGPHGPQI